MDNVSKAYVLANLANIQKQLESKADNEVVAAINKKSLELIKKL